MPSRFAQSRTACSRAASRGSGRGATGSRRADTPTPVGCPPGVGVASSDSNALPPLPCLFRVSVTRKGKRLAFARLEIEVAGSVRIAGMAVLAAPGAGPFAGREGDLGEPGWEVPQLDEGGLVPMPQDVFGRPDRPPTGPNAEDAQGQGGMWRFMEQRMPPSDVCATRAWLAWRSASDGLSPPPDGHHGAGQHLRTSGLLRVLPPRPADALSCALLVDNFPALSMLGWTDPAKPREGTPRIPGWTTVSLTTEWASECPPDNHGNLVAVSRMDHVTPQGRGSLSVRLYLDGKLLCTGRQVALLVDRRHGGDQRWKSQREGKL
ncbi:hypothetical protein DFJ74DRAFT_669224 [Hyaloraphidium curvatum]|nr:hypothetical protein DFJ74DRAFT_669224 [Hyaloraphidium curvatum]